MTKTLWLLTPIALASTMCPAFAQEDADAQAEIEQRIVLPVAFAGEEDNAPTLEARMAKLGVPSATVAVYRGGEPAWTEAYGEGLDTDTLFQAASLSKAVAAAGIVLLAMERGVSLDEDISGDLAGLDLARINPDGVPITLRGLLSHTNGAAVPGFPGYAADAEVPSTAQVVMGDGPTNTDMVVLSEDLMGEYRYSGGGYTIAQLWAEQVSGEDFPALMQRLVLGPVGMRRSLFSADRRDEFPRRNVAAGFVSAGSPIAGGWNVYPEMAAASLWTTPGEYALFAKALIDAHRGEPDAALPAALAREMLQPVANDYGLGIGVSTSGGVLTIGHSGSNYGYKSNFVAYPETGDIIVEMAVSESAWPLLADLTRTAARTYGWPGGEQRSLTRYPSAQAALEAIAGEYRMPDGSGPLVTITVDGADLAGSLPDGQTFRLVQIAPTVFIDPEDAQEIVIGVDADGLISLTAGQNVFVRQ